MSLESAKKYFTLFHIADRILEFETSSATVTEAAAAVQCREEEIAKTLSFIVEGKAILIVMSGDARIDNSKYKERFHTKAVMAKPEEMEKMVGHAAGGVCPFGIMDGVAVYLDISLKRFDHAYPGCGSENSIIRLTLEEMEKYSGYREWIDVSRF
jgi:prolyl-tRNA editing enzyme YbaK/EbsC (Cys-tRNA(Pro) deacylase)